MSIATPPSNKPCLTPAPDATQDRPPAQLRPTVVRRATSQILSYYHSSDAGRTYIPPAQDRSPPDSPSSSYSDFGERFFNDDGSRAPDEVVYARRKCGGDGIGDVGTAESVSEEQHQISPLQRTPLRSSYQQHVPTSAQLSTPPLSSVSCSTPSSAASPRLRTPASREFAPPSSFDLHLEERTVAKPGQHRRRTSSRSLGAADKRRIAIVEVDGSADESAVLSDGVDRDISEDVTTTIARSLSNNTTASSSSSGSSYSYSYFDAQGTPGLSTDQSGEASNIGSLRARRGFVGTFALVAPPDASPSAYTDFTPPLTAPPGVQFSRYQFQQPVRDASGGPAPLGTHLRSKSEATGAISVNTSNNTASSVASSSTASSCTEYDIKASPRSTEFVKAQKTSAAMGDTCHTSAADLAARTPERHARAQAQLDAAQAQLLPSSLQSSALSQTSSQAAARNGNGTAGLSSPPMSVDTLQQQQHRSTTTRSPRIDVSMNAAVEKNQARATVATTPFPSATSNNAPASAPPVANTYLYYQPGIHATAGPLPSPPRQIFPTTSSHEPPPPRPPRLHTPAIGNPALGKRSSDTSIQKLTEQQQHIAPSITPSTTTSTLVNSNSSHEDSSDDKKIISEEPIKPTHSREGAFPMNSVIVTDAKPPQSVAKEALSRRPTMDEIVKDLDHAIDEAANRSAKENVPPTHSANDSHKKSKSATSHTISEKGSARDLKRPKSRPVLELRREESKSTFRPEQLSRSPSSNYSDDEAGDISKPLPDPFTANNRSQVLMSPQDIRDESPQRPQSPHKLFDFAKRFSALPRPPSRMSLSKSSNRSNVSSTENIPPERPSFENTPTQNKVRRSNAPKTLSAWPGAMNFNDVLVRRSPLERSLAYARKINELANYDSGLSDWVVMTRHNLTTSGNPTKRVSGSPLEPRSPSDRAFSFKPRHSSRGSIGSEMTFPKRADAYIATDLLAAPLQEPVPKGPPPTLPYPILAQGVPPHLSANRSIGLGSPSVRSTSSRTIGGGGGFFASIGRKTSTKRDRGLDAPPNKLISKRAFASPPTPDPRPVQLSASPSLPGGPRAPPGRMQRAQSVIAQKTPPASSLLPGPGSAQGHGNAESENEAVVAVSRRASAQRAPSAMVARSATLPQSSSLDTSNLEVQLARLADILPNARKDILAGYLARAGGQEMLALGRYLDDEKSGLLSKV